MAEIQIVDDNSSNLLHDEARAIYKLTYFPVMALAEPIRWLLSYGHLQFEDIRITQQEWTDRKDSAPFGMLPILETNGKVMHQSIAICRYLSNLIGLSGDNEWENYEIDVVIDTITDFRGKISEYNKLRNDSDERASRLEVLLNETIPFYFSRLESMAASGYLANRKLSWADIYFTAILDYTCGVLKTDILDGSMYLSLDKIRNEVREIPEIKSWIRSRPSSDY